MAHLPSPVSLSLDLSNVNTNCCNGSQFDCLNGCCTGIQCCTTTVDLQNVRVVASGPNSVSIERPPGCGTSCCEILYEIFCCRCSEPRSLPVDSSRFDEGKRLYQQSLVERLGPGGAQIASNYIGKPKLMDKQHLTAQDAQKLEQAVGHLQGQMKNLDTMVKHFRIHAAKADAKITEIPRADVRPDQAIAVNVQKRGKTESFQEKQLRDDLSSLPLRQPLQPEQINQIVQGVKGALLAAQAAQVDSAFIRVVVAQELENLGIDITKDIKPVATGQPSNALLSAVKEKDLDSLNAQELRALLALSPGFQSGAAAPKLSQGPQGPLSQQTKPLSYGSMQ